MSDFKAEDFAKAWMGGYSEGWEGYPEKPSCHDVYRECIFQFLHAEWTCMEIGCGTGFWTKWLADGFAKVVALDVLPVLKNDNAYVEFIQVPDRNYKCDGVPSGTIDFVWSFGVFCHLSQTAQRTYLRSIHKKMKRGARGVIAFANWSRHPTLCRATSEEQVRHRNEPTKDNPSMWFYNDWNTTTDMLLKAGFESLADLMPEFRDTLVYFEKP